MSTFDQSLHSEQWVLGAVMLLPEGFEVVQPIGLTSDSFSHQDHRDTWLGITAVAAKGESIDPLSVFEALRSIGRVVKLEYLVELVQSSYGASGLKTHAERVKSREIERGMRDAGLAIAGFAEDPQITMPDKLAKAQQLVGAIGRVAVRSAPRSVAEIAIEQTGKWDSVQRGDVKPGWPLHIPSLDKALNGGFKPGSLVILAARPSVGKSSFAQQLALTICGDGRPALFLSQEMPSGELADRAAANMGRIDYGAIQSGTMSEEDWSRASEAMDRLSALPYSIDDQASLTLMDIRTKARMVPGLKLLVLDYLQLCAGGGDNRNAEIEQISRGLKSLAKDMGLVVIALSQLNRAVEQRQSKRPMLSDLRDSGAIEQDADVVMFLWPVRDLGDHRIVGCGIDKNRQGRLMEVGLSFFGQYQRWAESTADINPPQQPMNSRKGFNDN